MGAVARIDSPDGSTRPDPLFLKLVEKVDATIVNRKVPLAALRVGFDSTYKEHRNGILNRLKGEGRLNSQVLDELEKQGVDRNRLNMFQHTHLGLGQLFLDGAIDICRRTQHQQLLLIAPNENSTNLVQKSGYPATKSKIRGNNALVLDTNKT